MEKNRGNKQQHTHTKRPDPKAGLIAHHPLCLLFIPGLPFRTSGKLSKGVVEQLLTRKTRGSSSLNMLICARRVLQKIWVSHHASKKGIPEKPIFIGEPAPPLGKVAVTCANGVLSNSNVITHIYIYTHCSNIAIKTTLAESQQNGGSSMVVQNRTPPNCWGPSVAIIQFAKQQEQGGAF